MSLAGIFRRVSYDDLPGWRDDDPAEALSAFARCCAHARERPYRTGRLGVPAAAFAEAGAEAAGMQHLPVSSEARAFFERHFLPFHVRPPDGGTGFVTGYYEPEAEASPAFSAAFPVPLYRRPGDLVAVDDDNRPDDLDPAMAFARNEGARLVPYHDREAIDRGALEGQGLELCWLADRVDAFFIHVQGAARLAMPDGTKRVTYAAKSGHPFTGIGGVLARAGEIAAEDVTMQSIRAWLSRNPHRRDEILWRNRSYIFFRETPPGDPDLGPVAAAKVQLQPGRAMAVDRLLHTFGTPFFVDAPALRHVAPGGPFRRLMIAQDTGSAITGPARGDLFIGTGAAAGEIAGTIRHDANFFALLPRRFVGEAAR